MSFPDWELARSVRKPIHMKITLNQEQRLFIISANGGCSTYGFDHVAAMIIELQKTMGLTQTPVEVGTIASYELFQSLIYVFGTHPASKKTWYQPGTSDLVKKVIDKALANTPTILRIFVGNTATGYDWCEENEVVGYVGRSGGIMKSPLLMPVIRDGNTLHSSNFGGAINCSSILRIIDVVSEVELYRSPVYQAPNFTVEPAIQIHHAVGLKFSVHRLEGGHTAPCNVANFKTIQEADSFVAFMKGIKVTFPFKTQEQLKKELAY